MKHCVFISEKDFRLFTRKWFFCLKRSKFVKLPTEELIDFLWNCAHVLSLAMPTKMIRKLYFLNRQILRKQNKNKTKKIHAQIFRHCYVQHMFKMSGKNSKPYFSWRSWKFSIFKQKTWFLIKNKSLSKLRDNIWDKVFKNGPSKICGRQPIKNLKEYSLVRGLVCLSRPYPFKFFKGCLLQILLGPFFNTVPHFSVQNQYNQKIIKFVLKSNIPGIHIYKRYDFTVCFLINGVNNS